MMRPLLPDFASTLRALNESTPAPEPKPDRCEHRPASDSWMHHLDEELMVLVVRCTFCRRKGEIEVHLDDIDWEGEP